MIIVVVQAAFVVAVDVVVVVGCDVVHQPAVDWKAWALSTPLFANASAT